MFNLGRNGFMGAMLAALAVDSTAKRQQLDAELAQQRRAIREEQRQATLARRAAEQAKRDAEARQRAARAESRRLLAQRIHDSLISDLQNATVGQFKLGEIIDAQTLARFAARVTSIVAREIAHDDR